MKTLHYAHLLMYVVYNKAQLCRSMKPYDTEILNIRKHEVLCSTDNTVPYRVITQWYVTRLGILLFSGNGLRVL